MIDTPNRDHEAKRQEIAQDVQAFLASGGKIRRLPIVVRDEQGREGPWTSSLGSLSQGRRRKKGEWTVNPGWEHKEKEAPIPKAKLRAKRHGRPVRIVRDGVAREFQSAREAARNIGVTQGSISSALKKGTRTRGWAVEYLES